MIGRAEHQYVVVFMESLLVDLGLFVVTGVCLICFFAFTSLKNVSRETGLEFPSFVFPLLIHGYSQGG
jgi:hypothetical protein